MCCKLPSAAVTLCYQMRNAAKRMAQINTAAAIRNLKASSRQKPLGLLAICSRISFIQNWKTFTIILSTARSGVVIVFFSFSAVSTFWRSLRTALLIRLTTFFDMSMLFGKLRPSIIWSSSTLVWVACSSLVQLWRALHLLRTLTNTMQANSRCCSSLAVVSGPGCDWSNISLANGSIM